MNRMRILAVLAVPLMLAGAGGVPSTPVADAAMRGDLKTVQALIGQGEDVNAAQGDGMTALHWAAERGDLAMAEALLKASAGVSAVTRIGAYTPLHLAARGGYGDIVVALLNAGADPNKFTATGVTALHLASASGTVEGINALLDKGADANVREKQWQQTPLVFAADKNRAGAITTLIRHGANPALMTRMENIEEETAKEQAAARRRTEVLISFEPEKHKDEIPRFNEGADIPSGAFAVPTAPPDIVSMETLGFSALAPAAGGRGGRGAPRGPAPKGPFTPTQIQEAIEAGRKVQESMAAGKGPVTEEVDTLNGGVAGFAASVGGIGGMTALHHAVRQGNLEAVKALLDGGAPINTPNEVDHTTPLLMATINGQYDVAMELVKRGADPNITANSGLSPLYATINTMWSPKSRFPQPQAVQNQQTDEVQLVEALLKAGANPNQRLDTQFWYFAYNNCGNANCGLENITGTTPFWRAAYALDVPAMRMLVKYGADPTIPSTPPAGGRGGRGGARGGRPGAPGVQPAGAGVDPLIPFDPNGGGAPAGGAGARGGRGGGAGGAAAPNGFPPLDPETDSASRAVPPGIGVYPIHAAAGVGYGNGFAGNAHRHAPDAWMATMKYLVEELHADVNQRDNGGYTPLHHAAARGDNEMIMYLVSKGADVKAVARNGRTTVDMANGPVSRITPIPETIALLEKLGAKNSHRCVSCF